MPAPSKLAGHLDRAAFNSTRVKCGDNLQNGEWSSWHPTILMSISRRSFCDISGETVFEFSKIGQCRLKEAATDYGPVTGFVSTPIPSIEASTSSPFFRNLPLADPTPAVVPVEMMSPGWSVT